MTHLVVEILTTRGSAEARAYQADPGIDGDAVDGLDNVRDVGS
ncbi:hypothetical protein [Actinoplanes sp. TBRC 11911]|nr:hypothetical protein [Actinoplanes sp. TBRC 11911]